MLLDWAPLNWRLKLSDRNDPVDIDTWGHEFVWIQPA
jgi:hypothetical protein